ncbi:hypothetical protein [Rouxiella sp. WC2420]|uniref:Uncharacterized protein n=1 Tax=Rouxiella sp. WC2420 TaxID=3234145 RepID=A0AB39VVV1_9GAMM
MSSTDPYELETKIMAGLKGFFGPGDVSPTTHSSPPKSKSVRSLLIHFANYTSLNLAISNVEGPFGRYAPNTSKLFEYSGKGGYVQWLAEIDHDDTLIISMDFFLQATPYSPHVDETTIPFNLNAWVEGRKAEADLSWLDGNTFEQVIDGKEIRLSHTIIYPDSNGCAILNAKIEQVGYDG